MANFRMERVNSELQQTIAEIINKDMNNPAIEGKIISVLNVDTAKDLSYSKIMIDVMGTKKEAELAVSALNKAQGFIRKGIKEKMVLHRYPTLDFRLDIGYRQGNELIDKINKFDLKEN